MRLRDVLDHNGKPSLYRREWTESNDPIVKEARAQTLAIQRLQTWLRLAYSFLALGVLIGYWGVTEKDSIALGILGGVIGTLAFVCVFVLRTGIAHGRANVNAMLDSLEGRVGKSSSR